MVRSITGTALALLESQPWPGNIRELKSAIEYAVIRADAMNRCEIGAEHLPLGPFDLLAAGTRRPPLVDYQYHLARSELVLVQSAIEACGTTMKGELARMLGYNDRFTFVRRIRRDLETYPALHQEFLDVAALFETGNAKRGRRERI